jgi:hypothetical protein
VTAGYSPTPLARKLGVKPGHRVAALGAPEGLASLLDPLPEGVRISMRPRVGKPFEVVIAFARTRAEVRRLFRRGRTLMHEDGGLWICWPKRSSPLATELREGQVREHGLREGLVDNKICAVDEDWSGLRFVVRLVDRAGSPGR